MSPELSSWLGQVPWVPLGVVAAAVLLWFVSSKGGKKNRDALVAKLAAGAKVIDVRTKQEYAGGHYQGALNIPVDTLASKLKSLGTPDAPLVVYCASGGRSSQAAVILKAAGFTDVTNAGGIANLPRP
jgi:phage shock protein E